MIESDMNVIYIYPDSDRTARIVVCATRKAFEFLTRNRT